MVETGLISSAIITTNSILFKDKFNHFFKSNHSLMPKKTLFNILKQSKIDFSYSPSRFGLLTKFLILTFVALASLLYFTSQPQLSIQKKPQKQILFQDIIGLQQAKCALKEVIEYMKNPTKYKNLGARMRKGLILYGPPGTGKTTLAKACAQQANVQFFACNASQFCEIYVGVGAKRVRQLFQKAKQSAPSIIFIDEIDAIGHRKSKLNFDSGSDSQRNSTINQLLSEMDGFASHDSVMVIGATNRVQMLDASLLRAGRFDLKIYVSLPLLKDRESILKLYLKNKNHNIQQQQLLRICAQMEGCSGADIQNFTNECVYNALRRHSDTIQKQDMIKCFEKLYALQYF